jgi:hypothetical protein
MTTSANKTVARAPMAILLASEISDVPFFGLTGTPSVVEEVFIAHRTIEWGWDAILAKVNIFMRKQLTKTKHMFSEDGQRTQLLCGMYFA